MSIGSTGLGVLLALVVLLLVFGSFFAALLPIISALFALGTAYNVIGVLSHAMGMPVDLAQSSCSSSGWASASTTPCSS